MKKAGFIACIFILSVSQVSVGESFLKLLRSLGYLGFFFLWGMKMRKNVSGDQIRILMSASVGLIIFWLLP